MVKLAINSYCIEFTNQSFFMNQIVVETVCTFYLMRYSLYYFLLIINEDLKNKSFNFAFVTCAMVSITHYRIMLDSFLLRIKGYIYITKNVQLSLYCYKPFQLEKWSSATRTKFYKGWKIDTSEEISFCCFVLKIKEGEGGHTFITRV